MIKLTSEQVRARQYITKSFVDIGRAPTIEEMSQSFNLEGNEVESLLKTLASNRALVLHPENSEVWVAHPFSNSPNMYWVKSLVREQGWWSNCCWCALGIAALVKEDVQIFSRWGGEDESFEVQVKNGKLIGGKFIVHMPTPVSHMWDNVIHTCSLMLPFRSEISLDSWCQRHGVKKGPSLSGEKCLELASGWYGSYLDKNWNRKSGEEVEEFFSSIGLDLNFRTL